MRSRSDIKTNDRLAANIMFIMWFFIAATTVILAILALAGMPKVQSGPGGLSVLGTLPNIVILVLCSMVALACGFLRPPFQNVSIPALIITVISYGLLAAVIFCNSALWGTYTLKVQIVDAQRKPLPGVAVDFLRQKGGMDFLNALLPDDVETETTTNAEGEVTVDANQYQHTGALVNMRFHGGKANPVYRYSAFDIWPRPGGNSVVNIRWSKLGEIDNSNMHSTSAQPFHHHDTLIVFLPQRGGDDTFDY